VETDTNEKKVQILMKVPEQVKLLAKREAKLACEYGWITEPTMTALYVWLINYYLATGIRNFILQQRQKQEVVGDKEEKDV